MALSARSEPISKIKSKIVCELPSALTRGKQCNKLQSAQEELCNCLAETRGRHCHDHVTFMTLLLLLLLLLSALFFGLLAIIDSHERSERNCGRLVSLGPYDALALSVRIAGILGYCKKKVCCPPFQWGLHVEEGLNL